MTFPPDRYTPFGYLRNPAARASSWDDWQGGGLRSTRDRPGFGWEYPWARRPEAGCGISLGVEVGGQRYLGRDDFSALDYHSAHHTSSLFSYRWLVANQEMESEFFLAGPDVLLCATWVRPSTGGHPDLRLLVLADAWSNDGRAEANSATEGMRVDLGSQWPSHLLMLPDTQGAERCRFAPGLAGLRLPSAAAAGAAPVVCALARGPQAEALALSALRQWESVRSALLRDDADFYRSAPTLYGDWPAEWRRGWIYDLETTRMLVFPPGGIFTDVWLAWMVDWPRAVLAEGSLDALRLSYAQPELAQRVALSLFRDSPAPNIPCVFQGGEYNMVAADGSPCGTSPAWCLPFYNLCLMYLRTLDRAWLGQLYPYLSAYLHWWLDHRTDAQGWAVYKCTWEAGEDCSPRLDPGRTGDSVILGLVRPVELQASLALSAQTLSFFARELGFSDEAQAWRRVAGSYRKRTQKLWDLIAERFRDWDVSKHSFVTQSGKADYWGVDAASFSPLGLTPLGLDRLTFQQRAGMGRELRRYDAPPACEWPSWSWVVLEAAGWAGALDFAARMAHGILERVYRENDRRQLQPALSSMPGVAREYWPLDLSSFAGSSGYGWGANTATILVRHVLGFTESSRTDGCELLLAPGLPSNLMRDGVQVGVRWIPYRGRRLGISYEQEGGRLMASLELDAAERCSALGPGTRYRGGRSTHHRFQVQPGQRCRVRLT